MEPRNAQVRGPTPCVGRKAALLLPKGRGGSDLAGVEAAWHACGWVSREPGRPRRLHPKSCRGAGTGSPRPRPWTQHLASAQVLGWYRRAQATKRGGMDGEESECLIVCAGQRVAQEGSSPSGALMESTVSKSGGNASLAVACWLRGGGQGVHREVESEGYEEQYRAVIEGAIP